MRFLAYNLSAKFLEVSLIQYEDGITQLVSIIASCIYYITACFG